MDSVVLRRQIGMDKDMFFINKKHVTKTEVVNMLESAGFSRSNPYYIVQQGKVKALAMMSNAQRLHLLKDVAGCKVYETRRRESMKLYDDAAKQQEQIQDCHEQIEERMAQLEEEKEELSAYQDLDKKRRALEYTLYNKELQFSRQSLATLDDQRMAEAEASDEMHGHVTETSTTTRNLETSISRCEEKLVHLEEERSDVERSRGMLRTEVAQCQLEVRDTKHRLDEVLKHHGDMEDEKKTLEKKIIQKRQFLEGKNGLREEYVRENESLEATRVEHEGCEQRVRNLQDIEGRASRFHNKKQRDSFLKKNIQELKTSLGVAT